MGKVSDIRAALQDEIRSFDPRCDIEFAKAPPSSWYTDPAFLELERFTTFERHWQYVGRVDQVVDPGDYFTGSMMKRPFVVVRDADETLRAFYNVCAHHGTRVVTGCGSASEFTCPYHGWQYHLSGGLKRAPRAGAVGAIKDGSVGLRSIPVSTFGPFVLLHFGDPPTDSADRLEAERASLDMDSLQFVARRTFEMDCNWKVFVDNYLDGGYHVPHMHKELAESLAIDSYSTRLGDGYSVQTCSSSSSSSSSGSGSGTGGREPDRLGAAATYLWAHPNFMINRYGSWMDTNTVLPIDARRCLAVFDYYHEGDVDSATLDAALRDSERVQQEDTEIVILVQEGLESGIYEGRYAARFEASMLQFHRMLAADFAG